LSSQAIYFLIAANSLIFFTFLQFDEDVRSILQALKEETSLDCGQERQIIWLLWHQRLHMLRQQTQIEVITSNINLSAAVDKGIPEKLMVGWGYNFAIAYFCNPNFMNESHMLFQSIPKFVC